MQDKCIDVISLRYNSSFIRKTEQKVVTNNIIKDNKYYNFTYAHRFTREFYNFLLNEMFLYHKHTMTDARLTSRVRMLRSRKMRPESARMRKMRAHLDRQMMIPFSLPWLATSSFSVVNIVAGIALGFFNT